MTCQVVKTSCPYCGVGCGVDATIETNQNTQATQLIAVEGSKQHPANAGKLCVKGSSLHETLDLSDRLLSPIVQGEQSSWQNALDLVADRFTQTIERHGADSVAFYLSGQLLTEDYYVANKLMKGFIGSANVDTNSRLCMSSAVAGYKRAFGGDIVPTCYEDLEQCDLLIMVGSNAAWTHPIVYQRIAKAKQERALSSKPLKIVCIDPRKTATCDIADLHLAINPGTDAALFNGVLNFLAENKALDQHFIQNHTKGFQAALHAAKAFTLEKTATVCNLDHNTLKRFFLWFLSHKKTVTFYSQGVNQSTSGTDKSNAIINCHLATNRLGKMGCGPFSITGQPNAMGGREVGGLANQLAAHMDFNDEDKNRVQRFWQSPTIAQQPGLKAVDLFDAVADGKIKAIWIMATNPVVSLPNAEKVKQALQQCEFVVVSDCINNTDTAQTADVLLPAKGWPEKSGTVTNSERCITRQLPAMAGSGEAKDDWWIIAEVAKRMGYADHFAYTHAHDIFVEHAALSGFENNAERAFDISGLATMSLQEYNTFEPMQWPVNAKHPLGKKRLLDDKLFFTTDKKACFIPIQPKLPQAKTHTRRPFILNTGRIRDQWHTMTRTGKAKRLSNHIDAPYVSINPSDAETLSLSNHQLIKVVSDYGEYHAKLAFDKDIQKANLFAPIHWTRKNSSASFIGACVNPFVDPFSGQPELKQTAVSLHPVTVHHWAKIISSQALDCEAFSYWAETIIDQDRRYEIANSNAIDWHEIIRQLGHDISISQYTDNITCDKRYIIYRDKTLIAAIYTGKSLCALPDNAFLNTVLDPAMPVTAALAGQPPCTSDSQNKGAIICSCFEIGENQIKHAIEEGAHSTQALGKQLKCGTNCGSCIPELKALLALENKPAALRAC